MAEVESSRNLLIGSLVLLLIFSGIYIFAFVEPRLAKIRKNYVRKYPDGITEKEAEDSLWNMACPCGKLNCDDNTKNPMDFCCDIYKHKEYDASGKPLDEEVLSHCITKS